MANEDTIQLESFELTLDDIASVDPDKLHLLSIGVGWPHRLKDWQMLRETGKGIVAIDPIGRLAGSAMWFSFDSTFATLGMVITAPRLQARGTGRWLMDHVIQQTGERRLGLNATRAAKRLYQSLGFVAEKTVFQCQGEAAPRGTPTIPAGAVLREIAGSDLAEIAALDFHAYRADRTALLASLLAVSKGMVLLRDNRIEAFSLCRNFGRSAVVGPVVAFNDADAIAVTHPHVVEHAGCFLRIDTRQETGPFAQYLVYSGLPVFDTVTTMSLGGRWLPDQDNPDQPWTYALASQAFG